MDMIVDTKKAIVTEYFGEWIDNIKEKVELAKQAKELLKKNELYQTLVRERNTLNKKLKSIEEAIIPNIEIKKLNENISMIKESVAETLDMKKKLIPKLFDFYKSKFEKNEDPLQDITIAWAEIVGE
jgi:hypothetical protein